MLMLVVLRVKLICESTPVDLAKLSNVVENEVVKKTDYYAKVTSIEAQITGDY